MYKLNIQRLNTTIIYNCQSQLILIIRYNMYIYKQGRGQVQYLYLSTYLSVLEVLEYLVYGNAKVLELVLVLDQKVLGTYK